MFSEFTLTHVKFIQTGIIVVLYILIRFIIYKSIERTVANSLMPKTRSKIIKKSTNLLLLLTSAVFVLIVWGVDQSELVVFMGSVLTVIGIAMFAQWSILSNITSGIIIFFNHNVKLDDTIVILDKDYELEGRVSDIGLLFVILKTKEGEEVSIPSNVFIQKMIKKKGNK